MMLQTFLLTGVQPSVYQKSLVRLLLCLYYYSHRVSKIKFGIFTLC